MILEEILFKFCFFFFGASIGSFLNVVIIRLPKAQSLSKTRSHCPNCNKLIFWYENIPVISFLFLRARCSNCQSKISWQYPITELLFGLLAIFLMPQKIFFLDSWLSFLFQFSTFSTFYCLFVIDLKHKLLPDKLNAYLALNLLLMAVLKFSWTHYLLGALIGFAFPYLVTWIFYKIQGKIGLGGGDIKLFCALGIYLGPIGIIHNIFFSCFLGAIISGILMLLRFIKRDTAIPFGPFIIVTGIIQIFFADHFSWLLSFLFINN